MKKIPECNEVAETPTTGEPALTIQEPTYSGAPRSRWPKPPTTGEGSAGIPYTGSGSNAQSSDSVGLGGYGI